MQYARICQIGLTTQFAIALQLVICASPDSVHQNTIENQLRLNDMPPNFFDARATTGFILEIPDLETRLSET